jgi:hypothetical protein
MRTASGMRVEDLVVFIIPSSLETKIAGRLLIVHPVLSLIGWQRPARLHHLELREERDDSPQYPLSGNVS